MKLHRNSYSESAPLIRDGVWLLGIVEHKGEYFCFIGSELEPIRFQHEAGVDVETIPIAHFEKSIKESFEEYGWTNRCNYIEGFQINNNIIKDSGFVFKHFSNKSLNEIVEELSKEI